MALIFYRKNHESQKPILIDREGEGGRYVPSNPIYEAN